MANGLTRQLNSPGLPAAPSRPGKPATNHHQYHRKLPYTIHNILSTFKWGIAVVSYI